METFTVVYRTGGTESAKWRKCLPVLSSAEAVALADDIGRMGYKAIIHFTATLEAIGMPTGWTGYESGLTHG
jgi:hypothetical protein